MIVQITKQNIKIYCHVGLGIVGLTNKFVKTLPTEIHERVVFISNSYSNVGLSSKCDLRYFSVSSLVFACITIFECNQDVMKIGLQYILCIVSPIIVLGVCKAFDPFVQTSVLLISDC